MDLEALGLFAPVSGPRVRTAESLTAPDARIGVDTRVYTHVPVYIVQTSHLNGTEVALVLPVVNDTLR